LRQNPDRQPGTGEALRAADAIVAVSRDLADNVCRFGVDPSRVSVVYNGIDHRLFYPGPADEARCRVGIPAGVPLLVCVANLYPVKGIDVLIEACAELAAKGEQFRCCIIGEGPLRSRLTQQIRSLGLNAQVKLMGSRP